MIATYQSYRNQPYRASVVWGILLCAEVVPSHAVPARMHEKPTPASAASLFSLDTPISRPTSTSGPTAARQTEEVYRLRVENTPFGRIEASVDGGTSYLLVGRVVHPATAPAPDGAATTPGTVLRGEGDGLAFSTTPGFALKLRPQQLPISIQNVKSKIPPAVEQAAITTDLQPNQGLFGDLLPPPSSLVRLQNGRKELGALPADYRPVEDDVFVFLVALPPPAPAFGPPAPSDPPPPTDAQRWHHWKTVVHQRLDAMARSYADDAVARARAAKRVIVSGMLTLQATLPPNEPDPIAAVTYVVDGEVVAAQNVGPFRYVWNTRKARDGEHVVEIRALNGRGGLLTRARSLVVVQNGGG